MVHACHGASSAAAAPPPVPPPPVPPPPSVEVEQLRSCRGMPDERVGLGVRG